MRNWFRVKTRSHLRIWLDKKGEEVLRKIGISRGQTVLDFGCGSGNYTIPTARIVGEEGIVYALDKNERALDELMQRAELEGLTNIKRMDTSGEVVIGLCNESVDAILLYDIFWYFPLTDPRLPKLLAEVYRISKNNALISVYPKHIDSEMLRETMEKSGFSLKYEIIDVFFHLDKLESGEVMNFAKKVKA